MCCDVSYRAGTQKCICAGRHKLKYIHTRQHTTFIIVSCAEIDRKMHVVIQRVKMVFG